jgi:hypothetical protein
MYSAATVASHLQEYNDDAFQHKRQQALEQTLRHRLIWVCYRGRYLWPAILYDNYRQLIHDEDLAVNVWFNIPLFWKRIEVATRLVWNPNDPLNNCRVARLLGRRQRSGSSHPNDSGGGESNPPIGPFEMVELIKGETFWYIGDASIMKQAVTDMALNVEYFRNDPDLYLDWHRAMDEMDLLLIECLGVLRRDPDDWQVRDDHHDRLKPSTKRSAVLDNTNQRDDNSLVAASPVGGGRLASKKGHEERHTTATWVQRAKEVEQESMVETCSDCSLIVLEGLYHVCTWKKDNAISDGSENRTTKQTHHTNNK